MSKAELKAHSLFDTLRLGDIDAEVKRHLMILLLTTPSTTIDTKEVVNNKKKLALNRLSGCVRLPEDFDYKTSMADALDAKYL